jgi:hypothetical protein
MRSKPREDTRRMNKFLTTALEKLSGNRIRIENAADTLQVGGLLQALKVTSTTCPLIRIGPEADGGYLVPDDLVGITALVSPGVSSEVGFDHAMAERGIEVYMADLSVDGPPVQHPRFHFQKKFLYVVDVPRTCGSIRSVRRFALSV